MCEHIPETLVECHPQPATPVAVSSDDDVRSCPICDTDNTDRKPHRYSTPPWVLKACADCGLVYLENPPGYEALAAEFAWDKTYHDEKRSRRTGRKLHYLVSDPLKKLKHVVRGGGIRPKERKWIDRHIGPGRPGGERRLLDAGCGAGRTLQGLPEGYIPFGIEISPVLAQRSDDICRPRGGHVVTCNAVHGMGQFEADFFDGIVMRAFLEHETQPRALLERALRVLKPGGRVIVKVPNYGCVNRMATGRRWCGFRLPDHVNYFTPRTMRRLVEQVGYRVARSSLLDHQPFSDNMWLVLENAATPTR